MRVLVAGTYDPNFARNRTLLRHLSRIGADVELCNHHFWGGKRHEILDRSKAKLAIAAVVAYARLLIGLVGALARRRPDVVLVAYPGHFDMPLVGVVCRLFRVPVVFDIFISLRDTIVDDRKLVSGSSWPGRFVALADRVACRLASVVLADTEPHADFFAASTGVPRARVQVLPLGAQEDVFHPLDDAVVARDLVMFHGTFIGLQGLDTIVRAAKLLEPDGVRVRIVGSGQDQPVVDALLAELQPANVELTGLVPLDTVPRHVAEAALCLGIFGTSAKASRVVPNKLYECLAVGRPVLTADTPAIRHAFDEGEVATSRAGDPAALAAAVRELLADPARLDAIAAAGRARYERDYSEAAIAARLADILAAATTPRSRAEL